MSSQFSQLSENITSDEPESMNRLDRGVVDVDVTSSPSPADGASKNELGLSFRWAFRWQLVLWPTHQVLVAIVGVFALLFIAIYFGGLGSQSKGLVHIDEVKRLGFQFQVDINEAQANELFAIPGIGKTLANRIVEYRRQNGRFDSIEELENVPGLGPKSIERLRPFILAIERD